MASEAAKSFKINDMFRQQLSSVMVEQQPHNIESFPEVRSGINVNPEVDVGSTSAVLSEMPTSSAVNYVSQLPIVVDVSAIPAVNDVSQSPIDVEG